MLFKFLIFFMSIGVYCYIYCRNKEKEVVEYRPDHKDELNDKLMNILLRAMSAAEIADKLEQEANASSPTASSPVRQTSVSSSEPVTPTLEDEIRKVSADTNLFEEIDFDGPIMALGKALYEFDHKAVKDLDEQDPKKTKKAKKTLLARASKSLPSSR